MNKILQTVLCALMVLGSGLFVACGDSVNFTDSDKRILSQNIYTVPENFISDVGEFDPTKKKYYLETGDRLKFQVLHSINGNVLDKDVASNYYQGILWDIEGQSFNIQTVRYTFDNPGHFYCTVTTTDNFNDILVDTVEIFVNTPAEISLTSPRNGYDQVDVNSIKNIPLEWEATGIDPWEYAYCTVYLSYEEEDLWESPIGTSLCSENVSLKPPTSTQSGYNAYTDSYSKFYWGVAMTVFNETGEQETTYSQAFSFSTTHKNNDKVTVIIPIELDQFRISNMRSPLMSMTVVNTLGDTLYTYDDISTIYPSYIYLEPQSNVTVYFEEHHYTEYKPNQITFDVPNVPEITLDTVYFLDKTAPTISMITKDLQKDSVIIFAILDNGSGVNGTRIETIVNSEKQLTSTFYNSQLYVPWNKKDKIKTLTIKAYDNAGNRSPALTWNVSINEDESITLNGPYIREEDLE